MCLLSRTSRSGSPLPHGTRNVVVRAAAVTSYELSVDEDNADAALFYEKLGFRVVGRYREFGAVHRRYRLEPI